MTRGEKSDWGPAARRSAIQRLFVSFSFGVIAGVVTSFFSPWALAALVGWDVAATIFLAWIWLTIWPMDADSTGRYAHREDPSRALADAMVVSAAVACLGGV